LRFAGIVIPPCQAAALAIFDRPEINRLLTDVDFEYANGAPGLEGDGFVFRDLALIPRLQAEIREVGFLYGGEGGIRTHGTRKGTLDFESSPFGHSGTSPASRSVYLTAVDWGMPAR
jgi:hypothetical protein